ncbi:MAG: 3,5-cyclic-nucleotide phosphodiesterase [Mucilaginibacter sp.]|nr:3,5-cyclic-nucleotide phosphodiesterase [Mucilaginibacter sp.]
MNLKRKLLPFLYIFLFPAIVLAQNLKSPTFRLVPLGVLGGIDESNLSAYMLAPTGSNNYICLDAGTLHYGIEKAIAGKSFNVPASTVLRQYI